MRLTERLITPPSLPPVPTPSILDFGNWTPDRSTLNSCTKALNVIPTADGYNPMPSLFVQSDAMDARCQGAAVGIDATGGVKLYTGNASKLYEVTSSGSTMTDRSKGGGYTTASDSTWRFSLWRSDAAGAFKIIATNFDDAVQVATVGAGTAFADMITGTNKPKARDVMVVGQFVVLLNTSDTTDGVRPSRAWWCGIRDETDFDPDAATQSDFEDLRDFGPIQRGWGGEYGLIFQQYGVTRMSYVGGPPVFRFDKVGGLGTLYPNSVAGWGRRVFYHSVDGFMMHDGLNAQPIGTEVIDRTFDAEADTTDRTRFYGAIDPINKLYILAFPGQGNSAQQPNRMYVYKWDVNKWSQVDVETDVIFTSQTQGLSLDDLDTVSTSIDTLPESLDHSRWQGGQYKFAAIDSSQKYAEFDGANLAATIESRTTNFFSGRRSRLRKVRPIIEVGTGGTSPTVTAAVSAKQELLDMDSFGSAASIDGPGEFSLHKGGRYHMLRMSIAAGGSWRQARGFECFVNPSSRR